MAGLTIAGTEVVAGTAAGEVLATDQPLSFWGGYDFATGTIIDRLHPLLGVRAAGRVLAVPFSKGSSTTTAVLLEAVRAGTAPAAILTTGVDPFFALASIVAGEMYGRPFPVVALDPGQFAQLRTGARAAVAPGGIVRLDDPEGAASI
jgi:predicted aconitase with swiveling domain